MLQDQISATMRNYTYFDLPKKKPNRLAIKEALEYSYINSTIDIFPIFGSENKKTNEQYDFSQPPTPSRLDNLTSFAILGIDIKITPEGEVKVIEVNGANSGMKGFRKAGVEYDGSENPSTTDISLMTFNHFFMGNLLCLDFNPCEQALEQHLSSYGKEQLAFIGAKLQELADFGSKHWRFPGAEKVLGVSSKNDSYFFSSEFTINYGMLSFDWESRYGTIARTLHKVEEALEDKIETDELFNNSSHSKLLLRNFKPKTRPYTEKGLRELVQQDNPEYVVIKPKNGMRGEGLSVVKLQDLNQSEHPFNSSYVVEPFVPSRPIFSSETNSYHDGCMRYVVIVEENKFGEIKVFHFGGYWRLSPKPITDYGDLDSMRANLAQGALAQKTSEQELKLVRSAINQFVPEFYENLMLNHGVLSYPKLCKRLEQMNEQMNLEMHQ